MSLKADQPSQDSDISSLSAYNILFIKILSDHNRFRRKTADVPRLINEINLVKNVASSEKEGGSCGGQDHLCKNDGRSFLSRFTAQSHADASTRWFPRSRGIRSVACVAFVFGAKFLPRAIAPSNERNREIRVIKKGLLNADHVGANATENETQIGSTRREMHSSEIHLFVVNYGRATARLFGVLR